MVRITLIILSFLFVTQLHLQHQLPLIFSAYLLSINIITFFVYAFDKSAARKGRWRIKELALHWLSLAGGWWGALIAQHFLRHKSVKKSFLVIFSVSMLTNLIILMSFYYGG